MAIQTLEACARKISAYILCMLNILCAIGNGLLYKGFLDKRDDDWSEIEMRMNEKRESAQIIQFPLNARFEARRTEMVSSIDPRIAAALDPAWYHMEAMDEAAKVVPPKH